jgi:ribosomal protein S12 methylthiotransferase
MGSRPGLAARVYFATLGCAKNEADSRSVMRHFVAAGVTVVDDPEKATHILVNTCGFIQDAKEESINAVLDACASFPGRDVLVMGCLVERYAVELAEGIPEVAGWFGVIGPDVQDRLVAALGGPCQGETAVSADFGPGQDAFAYLKISDGCDELCTFCAIPGIKGAYQSLGIEEIKAEADACLAEGARELVLVGQDTSRWSSDGLDLVDLIQLLAEDPRVRRLRLMYLQPDGVTERVLRCVAAQPKLCRYLDIPLQHSHPEMLRAMARSGDADSYLALLARARSLMPDVTIRSTFIVGFPGETERHFSHLLDFVAGAGFDYAGGFVYSPEEGTKAAELRPRVSGAKALARLNRLNAALAAGAERERQKFVGTKVEVMVDAIEPEEGEEGYVAIGRTEGQAPEVDGVTYIEGRIPGGTAVGDVLECVVTAVAGYDLIASCDAA